MADRTMSQRARDDEDHRHAMCGLSFDERADEELQDFQQRHYDFIFTQGAPAQRVNGGGVDCVAHGHPAVSFFAPGSSRARYPLGAKQGPRAWEETPARTGAVSLVPPLLSTP